MGVWNMNLKRGASGETRTLTPVKEPDFESGASTNSATEAHQTVIWINDTAFIQIVPNDCEACEKHETNPANLKTVSIIYPIL